MNTPIIQLNQQFKCQNFTYIDKEISLPHAVGIAEDTSKRSRFFVADLENLIQL